METRYRPRVEYEPRRLRELLELSQRCRLAIGAVRPGRAISKASATLAGAAW